MKILTKLEGEDWKELDSIIMFGYGRQGEKIYKSLKKDFDIVAIVDNSKDKQGKKVDSIEIISFEKAKPLLMKNKIIVTAQESNYVSIKKQLEEIGLLENIHFASNQRFITEWYYRFKKKAIVMKTDMLITSRCSLKCENCMVHIPYWKKNIDIPLEEIEKNLECYFGIIDFVMDMDLIGGEPFLYKELAKVLVMIGDRYRKQIGYIGLITNGTISPNEEILKLLNKYEISVSISDYSDVIDYKNRIDNLCFLLEKYHVRYMRNKNIEWFDFGITSGKYHYEGEAAYKHMKLCNSVCHMLDDRKLYYCGTDYAAQKGGIIPSDPKSYVDLKDEIDNMTKKRKILELILGYTNGIPEACKICGGFGVDNHDRVPAAIQLINQ